jgi:hypothetical protein
MCVRVVGHGVCVHFPCGDQVDASAVTAALQRNFPAAAAKLERQGIPCRPLATLLLLSCFTALP